MERFDELLRDERNIMVSRLKVHGVPLAVLLLAALAVFGQLASHQLLINWDDQHYLTENPAIQGFTLHNLRLAFSTYYVGNYAPIQIISYMLDYALWGLAPAGFLLANVGYHLLSAILLYALFLRSGIGRWPALFGALIFLLHPVQVESVAWASQRKNLLAMLFCLGAFHAWLSYRDSSRRRWYAASIILFALALLSKSVAVVFPVMLVLYELLVSGDRRGIRGQLNKFPFLLAALAVGILAIVTQSPDHGGGRIEYPDNLLAIPMTMLPVLVKYLGKLLWPAPSSLSILYYMPIRETVDGEVLVSALLCIGLALAAFCLYRRNKPALFWFLLFFVGLLPVSQLVPLVTLMNDRYLYFPIVGAAGFAACLGRGWLDLQAKAWRVVLFSVVAAAVTISLAYGSHRRVQVWQNSLSLFSDAVMKSPDAADPWSRLAEGYVFIGNLAAAQVYYERSLSLGELDNDSKYNLAQIYLDRGEFAKGYAFIRRLLEEGKFKPARFFLGEYYYRTGNFAEAERVLGEYVRTVPDSPEGLMLLGQVHMAYGRFQKARECFIAAFGTGARSPSLYFAMATLESAENNVDQSLKNLEEAFARGFRTASLLWQDPFLENSRRDPRFSPLVGRYIR